MENEKKYLRLNDIDSYKTAFHLSNYVWGIIILWPPFSKDTVGRQFVRSIDSISANIAEGFGRFGKKKKRNFTATQKALLWNHWIGTKNLKSANSFPGNSTNSFSLNFKNSPNP